MIQVGLLGFSSVLVHIFVFHLAEYHGAEKQNTLDSNLIYQLGIFQADKRTLIMTGPCET